MSFPAKQTNMTGQALLPVFRVPKVQTEKDMQAFNLTKEFKYVANRTSFEMTVGN